MNILELIRKTTDFFEKKAVESPRLQIESLLSHHLRLKRMELYLQFERVLSEGEMAPLREMVRRRAEGVPLQHLTGLASFYGMDFGVSPAVLIPRPETESLVEAALKQNEITPFRRVVDVGTGSGIIALTLARHWPEAEILAVDISPSALAVAGQNAERLGLAGRVRFVEGHLLSPAQGPFDLVISNPPYIASEVIPGLSREVRHDPLLALDGGPDGLDLIRELVSGACEKLGPGGWLMFEMGSDQGARVGKILETAGFSEIRIQPDLAGLDRVAIGRR
ncbi:MAG: peptide chain release factor N(5)-glutamine methyltransferase [Verrucomicrobiae bacterium]|nr:peptide chain release factor N(5)-glutamine methyltransferase [Verrucomicrobiae bacterium]